MHMVYSTTTKLIFMQEVCFYSKKTEQLPQVLSNRRTTERISVDSHNYETVVDINEVCQLFCQKHSRRLEGANLIFN